MFFCKIVQPNIGFIYLKCGSHRLHCSSFFLSAIWLKQNQESKQTGGHTSGGAEGKLYKALSMQHNVCSWVATLPARTPPKHSFDLEFIWSLLKIYNEN